MLTEILHQIGVLIFGRQPYCLVPSSAICKMARENPTLFPVAERYRQDLGKREGL